MGRAGGKEPPDDAVYRYETGVGGVAQALIVLALVSG